MERGCHLLDLLPVEEERLFESEPPRYESLISSGGPSWKETRRRSGVGEDDLNRSGFACGRAGLRGGSAGR